MPPRKNKQGHQFPLCTGEKNREFTNNACHANLTNMEAYFVTKIDKVYKIHLQNLVFILKKLINELVKNILKWREETL